MALKTAYYTSQFKPASVGFSAGYSAAPKSSPAPKPAPKPAQNYTPAKNYTPANAIGQTKSGAYITPKSSGQVIGASTTNSNSGSGGGGNSGGGGGGGYQQPQYQPEPQTYFDPGTGMSFGSYGDYLGEIDNSYNEQMGILSGSESKIRQGQTDYEKSLEEQYKSQLPLLAQSRDVGLGGLSEQEKASRFQEQNALAEARRLYNELNTANRQRFGGATSAGMAASEILGREQQRQFGDVRNTAGQNIQKILEQRKLVEGEYQNKLQSLESQKNAALSQARQQFQDRLLQIDNSKMQLAGNKAQMKLQALMQLRAEANAIQQQATQFQQQLALQRASVDEGFRNQLTGFASVASQRPTITAQRQATGPTIATQSPSANTGSAYATLTGAYRPTSYNTGPSNLPTYDDLLRRLQGQ